MYTVDRFLLSNKDVWPMSQRKGKWGYHGQFPISLNRLAVSESWFVEMKNLPGMIDSHNTRTNLCFILVLLNIFCCEGALLQYLPWLSFRSIETFFFLVACAPWLNCTLCIVNILLLFCSRRMWWLTGRQLRHDRWVNLKLFLKLFTLTY